MLGIEIVKFWNEQVTSKNCKKKSNENFLTQWLDDFQETSDGEITMKWLKPETWGSKTNEQDKTMIWKK